MICSCGPEAVPWYFADWIWLPTFIAKIGIFIGRGLRPVIAGTIQIHRHHVTVSDLELEVLEGWQVSELKAEGL